MERNTHRQNQNALRFGRVSFADAFSAPIVGEYADVTARRSVTHLTFANASSFRWYGEYTAPTATLDYPVGVGRYKC
ncbi:MAG: hypothetical protein LBQ66_02185 [Planctomycetaceae bacterium]|nr:hypothetical protein [Planctomycetaceae bacterium]